MSKTPTPGGALSLDQSGARRAIGRARALAAAAYPTLHSAEGNTGASTTTATLTMADPTPAGQEASLLVVVGGLLQKPSAYACDGSNVLHLGFTIPSHTDWHIVHAHAYTA